MYKWQFLPSSTKCDDIKLAVVSLPVKIPNGKIIHSTHTGLIPNDSIPLAARHAHLFKELDQALISIGVFCDNRCMALFDDTQVVIFNKETKEILMRVPRNTLTGLYMLDLVQKIKQSKIMTELEIPDTYFANHVYECRTKQNLAIYYHLTLFSPPVSTWLKVIKTNYFSTWPGLTADLVPRYLPSESLDSGKMDSITSGSGSTWGTEIKLVDCQVFVNRVPL